jgi:asparagine synthase (glutamine-hydrolysing)
MSIICGMLKEPGAKVEQTEVLQLSNSLGQYATGVPATYLDGRMGMGLLPYSSHARSILETRPFLDVHGNVLCFDGRLDNFRELAGILGINAENSSDSIIVLTALQRWSQQCFSRLTGDWALSLWVPREQKLYLARDHAGTRSLYYSCDGHSTAWATYPDCLTPPSEEPRLSREYAAAYLSCSPVRDLTPYEDIRSVLPGYTLVFEDGIISQRRHWTQLIRTFIRYKTDAEYDEHFLALFQRAVERRTGPGAPVLAQLSGGMDSTSIVCMSDHIQRARNPEAKLLDTISFFDDSETSLDERRYFSVTEAKRGKVGIHLDVAFSKRTFDIPDPEVGSYAFPGADSFAIKQEQLLYQAVWEKGYRAVLSGIGGDEVLGGVPNGLPQLADYLASGHFVTLIRQAVAWSLPDRSPLVGTLCNTARYAARLYTHGGSGSRIPSWLSPQLRDCVIWDTWAMDMIPARFGIAPHRLDNALTWWRVMETLPHLFPQRLFRPEYRYPMLDKDLVEFLFSIPPQQLVKPGRRRFLMRRALHGIVPDEILERRRKAFLLHAPMHAISEAYPKLQRLLSQPAIADMGFINVEVLQTALKRTADGDAACYQAVLRAIAYELWLKSKLGSSRTEPSSGQREDHPSLAVR